LAVGIISLLVVIRDFALAIFFGPAAALAGVAGIGFLIASFISSRRPQGEEHTIEGDIKSPRRAIKALIILIIFIAIILVMFKMTGVI